CIAATHNGLFNYFLSTDLDGKDSSGVKHFIINLAGIAAPQSNMIYVDDANGHDSGVYIGVRGSTMPFASLGAAVSSASDGDVVIARSGSTISSTITVNKSLTIKGEGGAKFTAPSETAVVLFSITAPYVTIDSLDIHDGRVSSTSWVNNGAIETTAAHTTVK